MAETPSQLLNKGAAELNLTLSDRQSGLFLTYLEELKEWNSRFNLTSITEDKDIIVKHFLDSLSLLSIFKLPTRCALADIGSGPGFPGIPLKIVRDDIQLTLIESSRKKSMFLEHMVKVLELRDVVVATERVEDFGRKEQNRERFDFAISRAVVDISVLAEYALPLLKMSGRFISYKAKEAQNETSRADKVIKLLGGRVEEIAKVMVPFLNAERFFVLVIKVAPSPQIYPRKAGIPSKKPLA